MLPQRLRYRKVHLFGFFLKNGYCLCIWCSNCGCIPAGQTSEPRIIDWESNKASIRIASPTIGIRGPGVYLWRNWSCVIEPMTVSHLRAPWPLNHLQENQAPPFWTKNPNMWLRWPTSPHDSFSKVVRSCIPTCSKGVLDTASTLSPSRKRFKRLISSA